MKRAKTSATVTVNRKARYDYALGEELVCGMALAGPQVRQIRDNHVQLKGAFVTVREGGLWLNNLTLGAETTTNIRLLATKRQILDLTQARADGLQLVPVRLLAGGRYIKLVIALGKSKKKYDKRENIKKRDIARRGAERW